MTDFIVFWNEKYRPYDDPRQDNDLLRLITKFNKEGHATDWWVFWSKEVAQGDRVFLKKTGRAPKGIIGEGVVTSAPTLRIFRGKEVPAVDVRFDKLVDPYLSFFLVSERDLVRIAGKQIIQKSGSKLNPKVGAGLAAYIAEHHEGFSQSSAYIQQQALLENKERLSNLTETEKNRLVKQRIGQDVFRKLQMEYWGGRCCLSGLETSELLRASHIRAWSQSDHNQRLDRFNGLLLAAHLDAAFDRGLISVDPDGKILKSSRLNTSAVMLLGLDRHTLIKDLNPQHHVYLNWHRNEYGY